MFHIKPYKNTSVKNKRTLKQATLRPLPVVTFVLRGNPWNKSSKNIPPPKVNKQIKIKINEKIWAKKNKKRKNLINKLFN